MRRAGHDMREGDWIVVASEDLASDQAREVGHIDHQDSANFICQLAHLREVKFTWLGAITSQQDQRSYLMELCPQLIEIDQLALAVNCIAGDIKAPARDIVTIPVG